MKESGEEVVDNIAWREGFDINHQHQHAVVNVQTIKKSDNSPNEIYQDHYLYYNYDYYVERDKSYKWYGFSTSSDTNEDIYRVSYYICHYTSKPEIIPKEDSINVTTPSSDVTVTKEPIDHCFCSTEHVYLKTLEESQTFTSPGYPKNYCSDNSCKWVVSTEHDFVIKLEWIVFNTENEFDKVFIYDGELSEKSALLETFASKHNESSTFEIYIYSCSGIQCSEHKSSNNKLQIHFSADHVTTNMGFKFRVMAVDKDPCYCAEMSTIMLTNHGESYTIYSPNNPNPYCVNHKCSWSISAPEGYGLNIVANEFSLEQDADFLYIYDGVEDGSSLLANCTGTKKCESTISTDKDIRIRFESDAYGSGHLGFSTVVTAVSNFCSKESLIVPAGTISYSEVREKDGEIPVGGIASLTCPPNFKLSGTINDTFHSTTCELMNWDQPLGVCVQVCENIKWVPPENAADVHVCELFEETTDYLLVPTYHPITLKHYDLTNFEEFTDQVQTISCSNEGWPADHPLCHTQLLGILIVGGGEDYGYYGMELYNPFKKSFKMIDINLHDYFPYLRDFAAAILPDGRLLMTGGSSALFRQPAPTYILDIQTMEMISGPEFSIASRELATAMLDGILYMCWGSHEEVDYEGCETLEDDRQWKKLRAPTVSERCGYPALVASKYHIYMIGGDQCDPREKTKIVEKYSPEGGEWEPVSDMNVARNGLAAAFFNDQLIVCGGEYEDGASEPIEEHGVYSDGSGGLSSCEKYIIAQDRWHPFPSMIHPRRWHSLVVFGGKLFAVMGTHKMESDNFNHEFQRQIEVFDVENNKWQLEMDEDGNPIETFLSHQMGRAVAVPGF